MVYKKEMNHKNRIKYHFNDLAEDYCQHNYGRGPNSSYFYPELFIRHQYILNMLKGIEDREEKRVLEIGCGSGKMAVDLALKGYQVFGIDLSNEMIKKTSELISENLDGNRIIYLSMGDIEALPFKEEYFDIVIAAGVVEYLEKDDNALNEINRVLKSGGVMILSVRNGVNIARVFLNTRNIIRKIPILNVLTDWFVDSIRLIFDKPRNGKPIYRTYVPWRFSKNLLTFGFKKEDFSFYRFAPFPGWMEEKLPGMSIPTARKLEVFSKTILGYLANGYLVKARKIG